MLSFQVCVTGAIGAGKSSFIEAALHDPIVTSQDPEEEADGLMLHQCTCNSRGLSVSVQLVELPGNNRYSALLPHFGSAAACLVVVADPLDSHCVDDMKQRLQSLTVPPRRGLLVINERAPAGGEQGDRKRRVAHLKDVATAWNFSVLRCESLAHLEQNRVLNIICSMVLQEVPDNTESIHWLGTKIVRS
mmetsp:Transcript_36613/g.67104  ORF Transcript_36613/g.67104 Transcript_36613/m.67104 type:complete len:190 (-) Transcript_36613:66-635(-)